MLRFWYGLLRSFREPFSTTIFEFGITWGPFWWPGGPFWCLFGGLDHPWSPAGSLSGNLSKKGSFFRRTNVLFGVIVCDISSKLLYMCKKWVPFLTDSPKWPNWGPRVVKASKKTPKWTSRPPKWSPRDPKMEVKRAQRTVPIRKNTWRIED